MEAEFVDQYDRDTLTESDRSIFHDRFEEYKNSIMAITLSHVYCLREIAAKYEYGLIFEDDVILACNFNIKLENYMKQLPDDWDMLFIGDGCGFHIYPQIIRDSTSNVFRKKYKIEDWIPDSAATEATRCADSYLVSNKCAKKIIEYLDKPNQIGKGVDFWLNSLVRIFNFKVYWAEPTIVTQGSQNGTWAQTWS